MSTTLVSFIGTGRRIEGETAYKKVSYDFGKNKIIETSMFFNAIQKSEKYNLSEAIIIGTKTSAWATLLDEHLDKYEDLYLELEGDLENSGVEDSTLIKLEKALKSIWTMDIKCIATSYEIDEGNAFDIISLYSEQLSSINNESLLIDITHGFRSMPVLLMSALQFSESIKPLVESIDIIYGELKGNGVASPVRYLDAVWRSVKLSRAVDSFFQKFDSTELSSMIAPFWTSGYKAIDQMGNSLQGNLILWIDDSLKQLNNALREEIVDPPLWFIPIKLQINRLYKQLRKPKNNSDLCFTIAQMFADRKIYGQAVIALQLSFEAYLFLYYREDESAYGDYDKTKKLRTDFYNEKSIAGKDKQKLQNLNNARNMIAHGGSRSVHGGKPQASSLPKQYQSYKKLLERIYRKTL